MRLALAFLVIAPILTTVHLLGFVVLSRIWKVRIERFSLGFGPAPLRFHWGKTEIHVGLIPFGGYVKFKGEDLDPDPEPDSFGAIHPLARALIMLAGPLVTFGAACLLLGWDRADSAYRNGFLQVFEAVWSTERGSELLLRLDRLIGSKEFLLATGLIAAKLAAFNCLPIPGVNGGQALMTLVFSRSRPERWIAALQYVGILIVLVLFVRWVWAGISFLRG